MTTPEDVHRNVGAYALGVLDPRDKVRFEEHLTVCRSCPRELEELSSVAALLAHVSADSLVFAERSTRDPRRSEALIGAVRKERYRTRARHGLTLAACLALVVAGAVVAVNLGLGQRGRPGLPVLPGDSTTAQKLHAVSQSTGAEATVQVAEKRWGSQVTLRITHVKGPVACRLIAVSKEDQSEVVTGWTVPPEGYGTDAQPEPLVLYGGTDLSAANLSRFEVRTVNGALLVSVST
jgi:anti-sigma factor RsiW